MPRVTEGSPSRPSANPIATTSSPMRVLPGSANTAASKPLPFMRSSARSLPGSDANRRTSRGSVSPASRTRISDAPSTTCALVRISPSDEMMTPVPVDWPRPNSTVDVGADGDHRWRHVLDHPRDVDSPFDRPARIRHVDRLVTRTLGRRVDPVGQLVAGQGTGQTGGPRHHAHRDDHGPAATSTGPGLAPPGRRQPWGDAGSRGWQRGHGTCLSAIANRQPRRAHGSHLVHTPPTTLKAPENAKIRSDHRAAREIGSEFWWFDRIRRSGS
jgi:hypothetical protein